MKMKPFNHSTRIGLLPRLFGLSTCLGLVLAVWTAAPRASAQTPAGLSIQTYAGLTITGAVGTVYSVEYVADLAQTNAWVSLTNLVLPTSPYLWLDAGCPATGRRYYRAVAVGEPPVPVMVAIPAGSFTMGSPSNEVGRYAAEGPQTWVTISYGFSIGKYEVTQAEYQGLMGCNPSIWICDTNGVADASRPVEGVTWYDATNYCARLTQRERARGGIGSNWVYRLPTEAEWEYACRAGTTTRFSYGDDPGYALLANYAWYGETFGGTTHPVGQKLPNPWGLYDMHGNVCGSGARTGWPSIILVGPRLTRRGLIRGGAAPCAAGPCLGLVTTAGRRLAARRGRRPRATTDSGLCWPQLSREGVGSGVVCTRPKAQWQGRSLKAWRPARRAGRRRRGRLRLAPAASPRWETF